MSGLIANLPDPEHVPGIIQIGHHRLYFGDAYHIRPTLGWMDADVMDPPYVIKTSGGGKFRETRQNLDKIHAEGLDRGFDHRIIDPAYSGSVIVFCHNDQIANLTTDLVDGDIFSTDTILAADMLSRLREKFNRAALCVWIKPNPSPMRNKHYLPDLEPYIHAWNGGWHPVGDHHDMHRHVTARPRQSKEWDHPTVKPDEVMDKIMRNVAGQTVCDPFMGTGSTGVAAIKAGKTFTGIEHNPKHIETAIRRITAAYEEYEQ
ncbi:MAG: site-specific DNA-methyltransferase [Sphingomonadaceae bacterium]|nr:site-specific DNA-methyltransferase [Sphingomonadaceae bacterium]